MSSDTIELVAAAKSCALAAWPKIENQGYGFTKAGVMLDDLLPLEDRPRTLFDAPTRSPVLMTALDAATAVSAKRRWCWPVKGCHTLGRRAPIIAARAIQRGSQNCRLSGKA